MEMKSDNSLVKHFGVQNLESLKKNVLENVYIPELPDDMFLNIKKVFTVRQIAASPSLFIGMHIHFHFF